MEESKIKKPETSADKKESPDLAALFSAGDKDGKTALGLAAEAITKDNKLMGNILKVVLSPLGVILALCGAGYLLYQNKKHKKTIQELKEENNKLLEQVKEFKRDHSDLEKRYLKAKSRKLSQAEEEGQRSLGRAKRNPSWDNDDRPSKQQTFYLD